MKTCGRMEVNVHRILASALNIASGQLYAAAALPIG